MRRKRTPLADHGARSDDVGQTIVEFAIASMVFLMIVLGTIDLGRGIYTATTLRNAVREGARVGKVEPTNTSAIKTAVINYAPGLGLSSSSVSVSCSGSCATGDAVTVGATKQFSVVAQAFLSVGAINLSATAKGEIE